MQIAIISSAYPIVSNDLKEVVDKIIEYLIKLPNIKILTGGCLGVPGYAVKRARSVGIPTVAYSPDEDEYNHNSRHDNLELHYFNEVKHYKGFTLRSLEMIKDADCVLVLNGRMGTLSEFTIALEEGKKVGVITDTGGVSDHLKDISNLVQKDFSRQLYFSSDPDQILNALLSK